MDTISYKHSMPAGDLLSLLPGLRQIYLNTGKKAVIYQRVNLEYGDMYGAYMGATYSIKNETNTPVTMNNAVFEVLKPLLLYQEYIEDCREWNGERVDIDFDILRQMDTTMPYGNINRYPFYIFPDMACDLSEVSLMVPRGTMPELGNKILINRTERYNNMLISYSFLRNYGDKVLFVGLPAEHEVFCKKHNLDIPLFEVSDFLMMGIALKNCKLFIGNQSMCFQIAEQIKINRILEVCKSIPNVIGSGEGFYDFLHQNALEYYVNKLFNE